MTASKVVAFEEQDNSLTAIQVPEINLQNLHREIWQIHKSSLNEQQRYQRLIELLVALTNASGCVVFLADEQAELAAGPRIISKQLTQWHTDIVKLVRKLAEKSRQQQQLLIETLPNYPDVYMLASPVNSDEQNASQNVITLILYLRRQPVETFATILQLIAGTVNLVSDKTTQLGTNQYDLVRRIQSFSSLTEAGTFIVEWLAIQYGCQQVMLGLQGAFKKLQLQAISGQSAFDHRSELTHLVESAFSEVVKTGQAQVYQKGENTQPFLQAIAEQLGADQIVALPIANFHGDFFAAVILPWKQLDKSSSQQTKICRAGYPGNRRSTTQYAPRLSWFF